ncbi:MAG: hypothetical protein EON58_13875 [Alphaproteobacteria bacterium]|nr:MAG: hypothetical protein EON58_13875 [Alphaproteobacteria bacterium]
MCKKRGSQVATVPLIDRSDADKAALEVSLVELELAKLRHSLVQEIGKTVVSRLNVVLALNGAGLASTLTLTKEIRGGNPEYLGIPTGFAVFFFVISSAIAIRANATYKSFLPDVSEKEISRLRNASKNHPDRAKEVAARYHAKQLKTNAVQNFAPTERRLKWLNAASIVWLAGALWLVQLVVEWLVKFEPWYLKVL